VTETISVVEVIWVLLVTFGTVSFAKRVNRWYGAYFATFKEGVNGEVRHIYQSRGRVHAFLGVVLWGDLWIGIFAMTVPPNPVAVQDNTQWISPIIFIFCTALIIVLGWVYDRDMDKLAEYKPDVSGHMLTHGYTTGSGTPTV
jgi:hypothetical protein